MSDTKYIVKKTTTKEEFQKAFADFLHVEAPSDLAQSDPFETQIFGYMNRYLKTEDNCEERYYKCLTKNTVNLFGKELTITTMPFKEQDGAVASCASTALWMAFQKTSEIFNSTAPSLSEITILAGGGEEGTGRIFPSKGLSTSQVLTAISKLRMTPYIEEFFYYNDGIKTTTYLKSELHAYLKGDIPVLLGMAGIKGEKNTFDHLVTVNGYRYSSDKYKIESSQKFQLLSDRIEVYYVYIYYIVRGNARTTQPYSGHQEKTDNCN